MAQRLTESEIRARLFRIHGTKLRLKAYGGGLRKKSSFDCNECGLVWETTTSGPIYQRSGCPRCAGNLVTEEEVRARLQETHKGQVEMLVYGGGRFNYSDFKCKVCEHEWKAVPQNTVYKGSGCHSEPTVLIDRPYLPKIAVQEGLFWILQQEGWIYPYTAVWEADLPVN